MRWLAGTAVALFVLLSFPILVSNDAAAGDYYYGNGGYDRGGYDGGYGRRTVSYSSSCCYRKVVKHIRKVAFVRSDNDYRDGYYAPRYRSSYYDRPYRSTVYREPYRRSYYSGASYRNWGGEYYGGGSYRVGYGSFYGDNCTVSRVLVADGRGGWVWGRSRSCY